MGSQQGRPRPNRKLATFFKYLRNGLTYLRGSGISPNGSSPKLLMIGPFENCKIGWLGETLYIEKRGVSKLHNLKHAPTNHWIAEIDQVLLTLKHPFSSTCYLS